MTREKRVLVAVVALVVLLTTAILIAISRPLPVSETADPPEYPAGFLIDEQGAIAVSAGSEELSDRLITTRTIPIEIDGDGIVKAIRNGSITSKDGRHYLLVDDVREQVRIDLEYTGSDPLDAIEVSDIPESIRHGNTIALNRPGRIPAISIRFATLESAPEPSAPADDSPDTISPAVSTKAPEPEPCRPAWTTSSPQPSVQEPIVSQQDFAQESDQQPPIDFSKGAEQMPVSSGSVSAPVFEADAPVGYPWAIKSDFQNYAGRSLPVMDGSLDAAAEYLYTGFLNGETHFDLLLNDSYTYFDLKGAMKARHPAPVGVASIIVRFAHPWNIQYSLTSDGFTRLSLDLSWDDGIDGDFDNKMYRDIRNLDLGGLSDYDRAIGVYNYVAKRLSYLSYAKGGSIGFCTAFTTRKANCMGYSTLYQYLCAKVGLEAKTVTGNRSPDAPGHMWNTVIIDGQERGFDVTWADSLGGEKAYRYLCVGYGPAMDSEHIPD